MYSRSTVPSASVCTLTKYFSPPQVIFAELKTFPTVAFICRTKFSCWVMVLHAVLAKTLMQKANNLHIVLAVKLCVNVVAIFTPNGSSFDNRATWAWAKGQTMLVNITAGAMYRLVAFIPYSV